MNSLERYELKRRLLAAFFPNICPFCGRVVGMRDYWCEACPSMLPIIHKQPHAPENVSRLIACCRYSGLARDAVHLMKFGSILAPADAFALMMSLRIRVCGEAFDCLVPVPSSVKSIEKRGFSPADVIAKRLSVRLGIPVEKAIYADIGKKEQKRLSRRGRLKNARESFHIAKNADITGRRILLIDDVTTTGSTLSVIAGMLLENGAESVSAAVFAKVAHCGEKPEPKKYRIRKFSGH